MAATIATNNPIEPPTIAVIPAPLVMPFPVVKCLDLDVTIIPQTKVPTVDTLSYSNYYFH